MIINQSLSSSKNILKQIFFEIYHLHHQITVQAQNFINNYYSNMGGCPGNTKNDLTDQYHKQLFTFLNVCGKGGFGRVWKVQLKKNRSIHALKVMSKAKILAKKSVPSIMNERNLLTKIRSDFIVNMIASFQDRDNLYLLMDFLNGGDLRYHLNRKVPFNQNQIKFIIACIMQGLDQLHEMNIIHRDIKPQNIIFQENGYCRITDMGVARQWKLENSTETSGTPGYMAPEVMCRQNHSFCVDYYAVGVIAYQLLTTKRPYIGKNRKQIRDQILAKQVKLPNDYPHATPECIDFINRMIQRKPRNRLGYNGINQIKEHPWLKMTSLEKIKFKKKIAKAPFIPNVLKQNYSKYDHDTQPTDLQKQNMILLKKSKIQQLFQEYDFVKNKIIESEPINPSKFSTQTSSDASLIPINNL